MLKFCNCELSDRDTVFSVRPCTGKMTVHKLPMFRHLNMKLSEELIKIAVTIRRTHWMSDITRFFRPNELVVALQIGWTLHNETK